MAQLFAILAGISGDIQGIKTDAKELKEEMGKKMDGIKANTSRMENKMEVNTDGMREEMREMRGEMRQMGQCLQAGKMATPRAATNELGGVQWLSGPRWRRVRTG